MKASLLALVVVLFASCGVESTEKDSTEIVANTSCVLSIDGMMCEKGCKTTIQQKLSEVKGVVSCEVEYEEKTASLDFDNTTVSSDDLITVVNEIAGGIYKASLLEESVFIPAKGSGNIKGGVETDEVSVSDYHFQLPDFTSFFSNII